jgi:hypothetical protein
MLAIIWPASWILIIPIILVEALIARKIIGNPLKQSLIASTAANAFSTFIGLPICWGLLLGIEFITTHGGRAYGLGSYWSKALAITLQAPWLIPYESDLYWMIPAAAIVLLIPFFFMSVFSERWLFRKITKCSKSESNRWGWEANGFSYGVIIVFLGVLLFLALIRGR